VNFLGILLFWSVRRYTFCAALAPWLHLTVLPLVTMTEPTKQPPTTTAAPPKRDKFASMAAAAAAAVPIAPKRDKFASMAAAASSQQASPQRDKFASMAAASSQQHESITTTTSASKEEKEAPLKKRMSQRDQVLADLQQAEGWTWQLLTLASKTARSLSTLDMSNATKSEISQTSKQYCDTLQNIHSLLSPHASLVVAYENHNVDKQQGGKETKQEQEEKEEEGIKKEGDDKMKKEDVNMYAARVEMRLAQERRDVLKELLRLEQQEETSSITEAADPATAGDKRKREE